MVSVKDSGCGMEPALLREVFKPFTQSQQQELHRGLSGLGLGLSIAKTLVELHGGSLEARSVGANRGSEFVLRLPLTPLTQDRQPGDAEAPVELRCRVLVVDDNEDAAATMSALLISMGCESRAVFDGYEVARRMRNPAPAPCRSSSRLPAGGRTPIASARVRRASTCTS